MQRDFHYLPVSRIKRHLLTLDEKICPSPSTESLLQLSVCDLIVTAIMMHMAHDWTLQLAYCILYVCGYEFLALCGLQSCMHDLLSPCQCCSWTILPPTDLTFVISQICHYEDRVEKQLSFQTQFISAYVVFLRVDVSTATCRQPRGAECQDYTDTLHQTTVCGRRCN